MNINSAASPRLNPLALAILATLATPVSASLPQLTPQPASSSGFHAANESARHQAAASALYVLDGGVAPLGGLRRALPPGSTVIELSPHESGVARIGEALQAHPGVAALHLISHGGPGYLRLGGDIVSPETLDHYADALAQWRLSLHADAELLLYGCEVAANEEGRGLVRRIAELTGADVGASDDNTGNPAVGGDWQLEYASGELQSDILNAPEYTGVLADITVTSLSDEIIEDEQCTLREAIEAAELDAPYHGCPAGNGEDTIRFSVAGALTLNSALPSVFEPLHIDGDVEGNGSVGVTLDGADNSPILNVYETALTLSHLHLTRASGRALTGYYSTLTINDSHFSHNTTSDYGGAISNEYGNTYVNNSRFTANSVAGSDFPSGGAIAQSYGSLSVSNSEFIDNHARGSGTFEEVTGGAISCRGCSNTLQDVRLYENHAVSLYDTAHGGGLYQHYGSLTISGDSVFSGNISRGGAIAIGGAIYLAEASARIDGALFEYNRAYGSIAKGGAIGNYYDNYNYVEERAYRASPTVPRTLATTGNTLLDGTLDDLENVRQARAAATTPVLSMVGTRFYQNGLQALGDTAYGGAIFNDGGTLIMTGSALEQNRIFDETRASRGYGGAIFNTGGGFARIIDSTLVANRARSGGALFNQQALALLSGASVKNNQAYLGGGMVNSGVDLHSYNQREDGGALERKSDGGDRQLSPGLYAIDLENSSVSGNSAVLGGGVANLFSGAMMIKRSILSNNYAYYGGGGMLGFRGITMFTNSTLSANTTSPAGTGSALLATDINLLQLREERRTDETPRQPLAATDESATSALLQAAKEDATKREPLPSFTLTGLTHATVTEHVGSPALVFVGGQFATVNSLIGGNSDSNCAAALYTLFLPNHTLVDDGSCGQYATGFTEVNALGIGPLRDNGGPTPTHALLAASPALDAGDLAVTEDIPITTDQRGEGFPRVINDLPDAGAFEARPATLEMGGLTAEGLEFGSLLVDETSAPMGLTLTNRGDLALELESLSVDGDYEIAQNGCNGQTLALNESCTLEITFTPSAEGTRPGALTIPSNAADSPLQANLSGAGVIRAVTLDDVAFGDQELGGGREQSLQVFNAGSTSLSIDNIAIRNTSNGAFTISDDPCSGKTLAVGEWCTLGIRFTPTAAGAIRDTLEVSSNAPDSPHTADLSGAGVNRAVTLDGVAFGDQELGGGSDKSLQISNAGSTSLTIDNIAIRNTSNGAFTVFDDPCSGKTLAVDESCILGIRFTPTAAGAIRDTLEVSSNAPDSPHTADLSGNGVEADEPSPEPTLQQPAEPIPALGPLTLWLASLGAGLLGLLGMRRR